MKSFARLPENDIPFSNYFPSPGKKTNNVPPYFNGDITVIS